MRAEVVGVGTELLLGQIANTNARWISEHLATIGVDIHFHQAVGDNLERIVEAMRLALSRADVVIVTGGLGPTQDDITRDALGELMGVPMVRHAEIEALLRSKFSGYAREMPQNNLRQADVPSGARYIVPIRGTAPGLAADFPPDKRLYAVPGVPAEMVEMMENTIMPELVRLGGSGAIVSRTIRCTGIGESRVAEILDDLFRSLTNPTVAYLADMGEVKIRLTAKAASSEDAELVIAPIAGEVARRLGDVIFTMTDEMLEQATLRLLVGAGKTVAVAESLTGGSVGARLTSVEGASHMFLGSAVVYTAEAKRGVLGVSLETIEGPGVVSEECAREMAAGTRKLYGADVGVSLTGAAGPRPHDGAEPGTVWIALDADDVQHARGYVSKGERDQVRRWAEQSVMDLLRRYAEGRPLPASEL
jgi:nicotinamide-nucleotide amidase